jgi:hypothetical protein
MAKIFQFFEKTLNGIARYSLAFIASKNVAVE